MLHSPYDRDSYAYDYWEAEADDRDSEAWGPCVRELKPFYYELLAYQSAGGTERDIEEEWDKAINSAIDDHWGSVDTCADEDMRADFRAQMVRHFGSPIAGEEA